MPLPVWPRITPQLSHVGSPHGCHTTVVLCASEYTHMAAPAHKHIFERVREGHLRRLHDRDWSRGPPSFGYQKVGGRLVEVPEEAKVVRRIFDLFLELKNRVAVARKLNEEGGTTRRGSKWHRNAVTYILKTRSMPVRTCTGGSRTGTRD